MKAKISEGHLIFFCPGCNKRHAVLVTGQGRHWTFNGNFESPTLTPSVNNLTDKCHFNLQNGILKYVGDCEHAMAGTQVALPELPE